MSSKIFPPRLAPSADDPLREDREAEVDASSVVCLVFVASRSIITVDAFFFKNFPQAALLCGAIAQKSENLPCCALALSLPAPAGPHCRTIPQQTQIQIARKKKKTPEFKIAGKAKETSSSFSSARARERAYRKHTLAHTLTRVIVKG